MARTGASQNPGEAYRDEYRSQRTLWGLPLVHIVRGIDPRTGRWRIAKGIVAIGQRGAVGVVAVGGWAVGVLAVGGCAIGVIGGGGVALCLLLAFGGAAVGGFAAGGAAVGGVAVGGGAAGGVAIGGGAVGYYAFGGGALGVHPLGANEQDPQAVAFFSRWLGPWVEQMSGMPAAQQTNEPVELDQDLSVERRQVDQNEKQQYFLIRHKGRDPPPQGYGLVVILPGGPGSADFLPFCANVLAKHAVPADFLVAELVAPVWRQSNDRIVWPSRIFPDERAAFDTEAFLEAVVQDVAEKEPLDERYVFTLGWSSSGHTLYSASTRVPAVRGSLISMSRFLQDQYIERDKVQGKAYFLYHSPDDRICPYREAESAAETLEQLGAEVKLVSYQGGHGWVPFTFYADRIKEGILWLKE